jgi:hypothetical protein
MLSTGNGGFGSFRAAFVAERRETLMSRFWRFSES